MDQKIKSYQARGVPPCARNATQSKWNSFPNRNILFDDRSRRAARIDISTIKHLKLYAHQNGRNFTVTKEELKAFIGINFFMAINKLPTITEFWRAGNLIGNDGIRNTTIWNRFCEILQNLHFVDNRNDNKTDKTFKMRPVIDLLILKFSSNMYW